MFLKTDVKVNMPTTSQVWTIDRTQKFMPQHVNNNQFKHTDLTQTMKQVIPSFCILNNDPNEISKCHDEQLKKCFFQTVKFV